MTQLQLKDRLIIRLIGESPDRTILGLLPMEQQDQLDLMQTVRSETQGQLSRLETRLEIFPAASAYAIALALSKGTEEAKLWPAVERELGVVVGGAKREAFSELFEHACRKLGLVVPTEDSGLKASKNLRPIIFQAGILGYWRQCLADAVNNYRSAFTELDDAEQVARFALELAKKVPAAEARCRQTLESEAGPLICREILRAFLANNYSLLPPHLREPMREAFKDRERVGIRSPFLRFQPEDASLGVVLPKQSAKLASYRSCWCRTAPNNPSQRLSHSALEEVSLAASDLPGNTFEVALCGLLKGLEDQCFAVKLKPDEQDPFFVFRANSGKRLHVGRQSLIELTPGDYDLLLPSDAQTSEDESFVANGKFKTARLEFFPGRADLTITIGARQFTFRPWFAAGFTVKDKRDHKLQSLEGDILYYETDLGVQAFVPVDNGQPGEEMSFKVECPGEPSMPPKSCTLAPKSSKEGYHFYDVSTSLAGGFLTDLPPGIHEVSVLAEGKSRHFQCKFMFWKGFMGESFPFGFRCSEPPRNFDASASVGLAANAQGLQLRSDHAGAEVLLAVKKPERKFTLPKPGLWLSLYDPQQAETRHVAVGSSFEVDPSAGQTVTVQSGDLLPWTITCQGTVLTRLVPGHPRHAFNFSTLGAQFGKSGSIEAANPSGTRKTLLTFAESNLMRDLVVDAPAGSLTYRASFKVSRSHAQQLEVTVTNFAERNPVPSRQEIELRDGEIRAEALGEEGAVWAISAKDEAWCVELAATYEKLSPGIHFIDFRVRQQVEESWRPLKLADKFGLSESRLVLCGPTPQDQPDNWTRLVTSACGAAQKGVKFSVSWLSLKDGELADILHRLQEALLFKYATPVWPFVNWLETVLMHVSQQFYSLEEETQKSFAAAALLGLKRRVERGLSVQSTLLFGCQSKLLAIPGVRFPIQDNLVGSIDHAFAVFAGIAAAPTLQSVAASTQQLDFGFWGSFENFPQVASGLAPEFKNFGYASYFKSLSTAIADLDFNEAHCEARVMLSAEHFLACIRALNRRVGPLEQVRMGVNNRGALTRVSGEIQKIGNQLSQVASTLKAKLGIPGYSELAVAIPVAQSELVQMISDALLSITAMARMNSSGLLERKDYRELLQILLNPEAEDVALRFKRLCLLLSLGPELFSFYMLFWEAALKPLNSHERN
jgi:hypothetical protein